MNTHTILSLIGISFLALTTSPGTAQETKEEFRPPLFAFQTGFSNANSKSPKYLVELVKKSGFDGVELMGLDAVDEFLDQLESQGLQLYSLYLPLHLDKKEPFSLEAKKKLSQLKGKVRYIWLHVHYSNLQNSDPKGDPKCVEALREISTWCEPLGIQIGIYHHVGIWAEKFSDAVRIARKADRKNVGAVFNLCHYLRTAGPKNLERDLADAFPNLMLVSINGADNGETTRMGWDRLIQPLGQGTLDITKVLQVLKSKNYRGPIGFQGFAIKQKPEEFFPASVGAYREMLRRVNSIK